MTRPAGKIPQFSTDVNYPAGVHPWSAQATKIDPGLAITAAGFAPNDMPPAQWINFLENKWGAFLKANDAIEVQNWSARQLIQNSGPIPLGQVGTGKRIAFDPVSGKFWAAGVGAGGPGTATLLYSLNGVDWTDDTASLPGGHPLYQNMAINPADGYMYINSDVKCESRTPAGVYTDFLLVAGTGAKYGCAFDPYSTKFVWWGLDAAPHPALWAGFETFGSIVQQNLQNMAGFNGTSAVRLFAAGPTRKIAFYITTAPVNSQGMLDTAAYGAVWTDRGAAVFNGTCQALGYNDTTGVFMAVDNTGFTYISGDGINWTQQSDHSADSWVFQLNCLDSHGSIWTGVITISGQPFIVWSVDDGATWTRLPCLTDATKTVGCVKLLDDRLAVFDSGGNLSTALRAK